MSAVNPLSSAFDIARLVASQAVAPLLPQQLQGPQPLSLFQGSRPEPAWHPQVAPQVLQAGSGGSCGPAENYGPDGFSQYVQGQQARELDVDLMRMSYAAYGAEVDLCGWEPVPHDVLVSEHGWDPEVRLDVPESQFSATVFTDNQGNYVLAYRGTADGAEDWMTNFEQGAGQLTTSGEFEVLAPMVAQQFKAALGDGQPPGNLAITGHSQGGGLATVGSLVTGIPAVTFDPSGVHPDTLDRLGLDMDASRELAADGQIRRYSLYEDALTQAQQNIPLVSMLLPDALGHPVVLKPEGELDAGMIDRALEHPSMPDWVTPELANTPGVQQLVRAIISHDQQFMIDTMLQQQPWQDGWSNPDPPLGQQINDLVPQSIQDDYQRNVSDMVGDVREVIREQFADGNYVEGGFMIFGDLVEGFANSVGDTVSGYAGEFADGVRQQAGEWADGLEGRGPLGLGTVAGAVVEFSGSFAGALIEGGGTAFEWAADGLGETFETVADLSGDAAQWAVDGFVSTVNTAIDGAGYVVDAIGTGVDYALQAAETGWNTLVDTVSVTWDTTKEIASSAWDTTTDIASSAWDAATNAASSVWDGATSVWNTTTDAISSGASWLNSKMPWNW